jgi:hypothetical protein
MFIPWMQTLVLAVHGKDTTDSHAEYAILDSEKVLLQKNSDKVLADGLSSTISNRAMIFLPMAKE